MWLFGKFNWIVETAETVLSWRITGINPNLPSPFFISPGCSKVSVVSISFVYRYISRTYVDSEFCEMSVRGSPFFIFGLLSFLFFAVIFYLLKLDKTPQPQSSFPVFIWIILPGTKNGTIFSGLIIIFLISSLISFYFSSKLYFFNNYFSFNILIDLYSAIFWIRSYLSFGQALSYWN